MYAPPAERTSPLMAQLARLQAQRSSGASAGFAVELAAARNEVAHFAMSAKPAASAGLGRRSRFQAVADR